MPKIGEITVTENPGEGTNHKDTKEQFLYENQDMITTATDLLGDGRVTSIPTDITNALNTTPGLRASAFSVDGNSPLNAVAVKFASNTETEYEQFEALKKSIESDTNRHMCEEGGTNYVVIFTKYKELCEKAIEAANSYNANRNAGTTSRTVGSGDDEKTITTYHFYPEVGMTCQIGSDPTLSWSEIFPPGTGTLPANSEYEFESQDESPYYQVFREAFDKAKKFYEHYGEDTISFKSATDGLRGEDDSFDFDAELSNLENTWPDNVGSTGDEPSVEEKPTPEEETPTETSTETAEKNNIPVTVSCGQRVSINGEDLYFLAESTNSGQQFFTRGTDENEQVYTFDENGNLVPYISYGSKDIVTRKEFINDRKYNMSDYQWNCQYNDGTSPFDSVSEEIDPTFSAPIKDSSYTRVRFSEEHITSSATTLTQFDRGAISQGEQMPETIYLAPGQSIKYDKPWDTYDNKISGKAETGTYLIYDSEKDGYYVLDDNYSYKSGSDIYGLFISRDELLSDRTTISY